MAVRWYKKNPYGYYTETQGENKFKIMLCKGNTLWTEMYFYKETHEGSKNFGENMAQLVNFLCDIQHMKRWFKNSTPYPNADNFVFYSEELDKEHYQAIQLLAKIGKKVTIKSKNKKAKK